MFINLFCYVSEVNPNIVRLFACNSNFIMGLYSQAIVDSSHTTWSEVWKSS